MYLAGQTAHITPTTGSRKQQQQQPSDRGSTFSWPSRFGTSICIHDDPSCLQEPERAAPWVSVDDPAVPRHFEDTCTRARIHEHCNRLATVSRFPLGMLVIFVLPLQEVPASPAGSRTSSDATRILPDDNILQGDLAEILADEVVLCMYLLVLCCHFEVVLFRIVQCKLLMRFSSNLVVSGLGEHCGT